MKQTFGMESVEEVMGWEVVESCGIRGEIGWISDISEQISGCIGGRRSGSGPKLTTLFSRPFSMGCATIFDALRKGSGIHARQSRVTKTGESS